MILICSYCRKKIGSKPPLGNPAISHGMCKVCLEHFRPQWLGMDFLQYFQKFAFPVVLVSPEGRIVRVNDSAAELLGQPGDALEGLLGGEAMECKYALLPEGCGRTAHCGTCTVRRAVTAAYETERPQENVRASINRQQGELNLCITTERIGRVVRLTILRAF